MQYYIKLFEYRINLDFFTNILLKYKTILFPSQKLHKTHDIIVKHYLLDKLVLTFRVTKSIRIEILVFRCYNNYIIIKVVDKCK